ncbi:MAG TPA: cupredoxin domain-containing protein [Nitrospiraceae bacterium]|jgi:plastocyanin|nr:cupredoxin domain-containing protein [Nitrospiraceae bacterium]
MRALRLIAIVTCFLALAAAWPSVAATPQLHITIENGSPYFVPAKAVAVAGVSIRWENPTPTHHTVTHNGCIEEGMACAFDSGIMEPDGSYTIPSLPPGNYPYHCRVHPIMQGILVVVEHGSVSSQT